MAVLKCKMCGAALTVGDSDKFAQCRYCDSMQTLPNLDNELKMKLFERATELRLACDFDQAAGVFQSIIAQFPDEAEAYWGLVLCKYGIEYVDDPRDGKKVPTCHRTRPQSVLNDPDFLAACDHADLAKWKYEEEAQVIDGLQQKILSISRGEEPYDVFICYKETDDTTRLRTEDSITAQDIYTELIAKGYKVFFSRVTLRGKAGSEYEPYIYAALSSAKVMLVLGSKQDYFNAVWLKNEWSRYLEMMKDGGKVLIPCYDSIAPEQLPRQLQGFQALNVRSITFLPDLFANIERVAGKTSVAPAVQAAPTAPAPVTDSNRKELNFDDGAYVGEAIGDRPHGYGARYYVSGEKYEGEWHFGIKKGQGTYTYANGKTWTGEWRDDKCFTGTGTILFYADGKPTGGYYDGALVEGQYQGKGVEVYPDGSRYEGEFVNGNYCGRGVGMYADGSRYEGEFADGKCHGQGTYTYASGETWTGEWKDNNQFNGNGTILFYKDGKLTGNRYEGECVNGKLNGRGVYTFADGSHYEGEFADGKFNGQGTFTYVNGETWTGEWKDDERFIGSGTILYYKDGKPDGRRYDGELAEGQYHGKGVEVYSNGNRYEGEFVGGKRQGQGTYTYVNGETWTGEWKDDERFIGSGTILYYKDGKPDGRRYDGELAEGQYHGKGVEVFSNGDRYEGEWKAGKRAGHGVYIYVNGDRYEGGFANGKRQGQGTYTYASGETWTGEWKEDSEFNGNGTILLSKEGNRYEGSMMNGNYHGQGTYTYADGTSWTGEWKDGAEFNGNGTVVYYTNDKPNGHLYEGALVNGERHGQGTYIYAGGRKKTGEWNHDALFNGKVFDSAGDVDAVYKNGKERNGLFGLF